MQKIKTAVLHYTAPPVIGGVEGVIQAHAAVFDRLGYPLTVIAGQGDPSALPSRVEYVEFPEIDSQHPKTLDITADLIKGQLHPDFEATVDRFVSMLDPVLAEFDQLIVHNLFTKQYNIPLTVALFKLLDEGRLPHTTAWAHDIAWTSKNSRRSLHAGYPWDILKTYRRDLTYVTVSKLRQRELAGLFDCDPDLIEVIYNGVDTGITLHLSQEGHDLITRLNILQADLILLMPVRVTRLKNVEFAIHVLSELKHHFENPRLLLTGPPDPHNEDSLQYFHELQELRSEVGVEDELKFVYESGPDQQEGYEIGLDVVGDLYRVADLLFMPSHSEGFGMPVLEAGLIGIPIFATHIPAADEIGQDNIYFVDLEKSPTATAAQITEVIQNSPVARFRRIVRQNYTWESIFLNKIKPLLHHRKEITER
jgi:mannosylglucosylglycerate synthase